MELFSPKNKKKSKKTKRKDAKKNNNEPRVKISSLTCLFVYKVLNQEVLDDRGKFEVSLTLRKNEFWKVEDKISEDHVYLAHYQESEGFLGCLWQRIWSAIHFRLRSLKLRRELQALSNASPKTVDRQNPPTETDESFGWGWNRADVFPKIFKKHRNLL